MWESYSWNLGYHSYPLLIKHGWEIRVPLEVFGNLLCKPSSKNSGDVSPLSFSIPKIWDFSWTQTSIGFVVNIAPDENEGNSMDSLRLQPLHMPSSLACLGYDGPSWKRFMFGLFLNWGTPKWLVYIREDPFKMDDLGLHPFMESLIWINENSFLNSIGQCRKVLLWTYSESWPKLVECTVRWYWICFYLNQIYRSPMLINLRHHGPSSFRWGKITTGIDLDLIVLLVE